jgi:SAM-dependent methyltransferase
MEEPKFENYHDRLRWRLERRIVAMQGRVDRLMANFVSMTDKEKNSVEDDRIWLDQFANGNGLDIACGDFLVGGEDQALGVDTSQGMVGSDYFHKGHELAFQPGGVLDFVVTNYFDGMQDPLTALQEWHRVVKPGGVVALVCRDAHSFETKMGALENGKKQNTFCKVTLGHYLHRTGFIEVLIDETEHGTLRASGVKA